MTLKEIIYNAFWSLAAAALIAICITAGFKAVNEFQSVRKRIKVLEDKIDVVDTVLEDVERIHELERRVEFMEDKKYNTFKVIRRGDEQ